MSWDGPEHLWGGMLMGDAREMLSYWQAQCLGTRVKSHPSGETTRLPHWSRRGVSGWPHPWPSMEERLGHGKTLCLFFLIHPQIDVGKNKLGLAGWASLKIQLAPLALQGDVFQILTSHLSCSSASGLGFRRSLDHMIWYKRCWFIEPLHLRLLLSWMGGLTCRATNA